MSHIIPSNNLYLFLMDSCIPLFMIGFIVCFFITGLAKGDFVHVSIQFIGIDK